MALEDEREFDTAARLRIHDYLARTGLSQPDFARRINYSYDTLRLFLTDRYYRIGASARNVIAAADGYMQEHPIGTSARILGELYDTRNVQIIRDTIEQLLRRPVAYMLYGAPGNQKSFALEHEVAQLNLRELAASDKGRQAFYVYVRKNIRPRDIIRRIAVECGCRVNAQIESMISELRFRFDGRRVVLIFDEAQRLSIECLETIQELLDRPPYFSILLAGSQDLKTKLDEFSATLEQWNSRIIARVLLPGLEKQEARGIIEREIGMLLLQRTSDDANHLIDKLIAGATVPDAFNGNRTYINIRTLTNALDQIKATAPPPTDPEPAGEKVEAIS
jgi:type II secretory pathway predicted ATPase ExeA